jgi:hypothetical protein
MRKETPGVPIGTPGGFKQIFYQRNVPNGTSERKKICFFNFNAFALCAAPFLFIKLIIFNARFYNTSILTT